MNKQEIMKYIVGKSLECKTVMFQHYTHGQFYRFGLNEHGRLFTINDNGDLEEWHVVKVTEYFAVNIPKIKRFVIEVESKENDGFLTGSVYNELVLENKFKHFTVKDVSFLGD